MEETYVLCIDFGTLSGRAAIVRVADGLEKAAAVYEYPNAVMDDVLSVADGQKLPADFALQNPRDYIEVLKHAVPEAIAKSMVDPAQIKGIGIDFTSATVIAAKEAAPRCVTWLSSPTTRTPTSSCGSTTAPRSRLTVLCPWLRSAVSLGWPAMVASCLQRCCYPRC